MRRPQQMNLEEANLFRAQVRGGTPEMTSNTQDTRTVRLISNPKALLRCSSSMLALANSAATEFTLTPIRSVK